MQIALAIPQAPRGADIYSDVTRFLRAATNGVTFVISDPENCQSGFASALHPDLSKRPALLLEWVESSTGVCNNSVLPHM